MRPTGSGTWREADETIWEMLVRLPYEEQQHVLRQMPGISTPIRIGEGRVVGKAIHDGPAEGE